MPLTPEAQHDLAVQHRIGLSRYSTHVVRKVLGLLNRMESDLIARLASSSNESLAGQRLELLLAEIRAIQADGWRVVRARLNGDLADLAGAEAHFALRLAGVPMAPEPYATFSPLPPLEQIVAAVNAQPFQGRFLRNWLDGAEEAAAARVRDIIRQGFVEGRPIDDMVRAIRGTRALNYRDGALEVNRRAAEAMVRTAVTHTANVAAQAAWEANADVVKAWRFVATLDARTTLICASLHGEEFPLGTGPQPPRHVNCRSTSVPVLDPIEGVAAFEMPSYSAWLRRQPEEVQNDILGVAKAKLFRAGMPIDRFVDDKGRVLTLDQLKARDAAGFAKAEPKPRPRPEPKPEPPPKPDPARALAESNAAHDAAMRDYVLSEGRKHGVEFLIGYDAKTGVAFNGMSDGKHNSVSFPPWLNDKLLDGRVELVLHHNHPSSSSFSSADLNVVAYNRGAKGIWAHGHNGSSYYAEGGQKQMTPADLARARTDVFSWLGGFIRSRMMTEEQCWVIANDVVCRLLNKRGFIKYVPDLKGETLAAFERMHGLIDRFIANAAP